MLEIIKEDLGKYKEFNLIKRFAFKDFGIEMLYNEGKEEFYKRILEIYVTK